MRHDTKDVLNVANLCLEAKDKIIGFDIAGPELNFPPSLFRESFKKVKELGVNITIHAGEGDGGKFNNRCSREWSHENWSWCKNY